VNEIIPAPEPDLPPWEGTLRMEDRLESGVVLEFLMHSWEEMRWICTYQYLRDKKLGRQPKLLNKWTLIVDFREGLLMDTIKMSMHIIIPELLGQQRFLGVDISPGAKTFLEFIYERPARRVPIDYNDPYWKGTRPEVYPEGIPGPFYLAEISKGARPPVDVRPLTFPNQTPGLVLPVAVDFEFPFEALVEWQHGYSFPFINNDDQTAYHKVPNSLRRG
jgi:hypothetical protein